MPIFSIALVSSNKSALARNLTGVSLDEFSLSRIVSFIYLFNIIIVIIIVIMIMIIIVIITDIILIAFDLFYFGTTTIVKIVSCHPAHVKMTLNASIDQ